MQLNGSSRTTQRGFSMVEVLVTIAVMAVALLGVAKMQAAAVANTQISRVRSLIALQADSLAALMHGNRGYWAAAVAPTTFSATGTAITDATGVLNAPMTWNCATGVCTPQQLAAWDVQDWVANLYGAFPSYSATVNCTNAAGQPVSCSVTLTWSENYVAVNATTAASAAYASAVPQSYTLYIEP
jgi:type IV pilus assembly protein PilV